MLSFFNFYLEGNLEERHSSLFSLLFMLIFYVIQILWVTCVMHFSEEIISWKNALPFEEFYFFWRLPLLLYFFDVRGFQGVSEFYFYFIILYYFILFSKNTWGLTSYVFLFACVRFTMNRIISQHKQSYWRELIPNLRHNRIIYNLLVSPKGFLSHYYKLTS